ncbi:MAG: PilN domain-containing protein [Acidobacteria bacterium]|nr:PilN domain-containing protein [Acidobacteriota bacterium]
MNWSLLQTGIGIDARGDDFCAVCVKRVAKRIRVADRLEIAQYHNLSPAECGKRYGEWLRKNGLKLPWTVVALPRAAFLLRRLSLPRVVQKELPQAIEYQLDGLHPFEGGSVYWDFSVGQASAKRPDGSAQKQAQEAAGLVDVLVAIAEKTYINETAAWFREAGIAVSQFSPAAALLLSLAQSCLDTERAESTAFLALEFRQDAMELVGCAPDMPMVAKEIPLAGETDGRLAELLKDQLDLARAELRLDPARRVPLIICGADSASVESVLSAESAFSVLSVESLLQNGADRVQGFPVQLQTVALAGAFAAVRRNTALSFNLLPLEIRSYRSPWTYLPTYALSALVIFLAVLVGARGTVQDWLYYRHLEREIQVLRPQLEQVETAQSRSQQLAGQLQLLEGAKSSAHVPLEILSELTRLLPEDVWLQQMQYDGSALALSGYARSASGLLQTLAASAYFESPQFTAAITSTPDGNEIFRIGVRLRVPGR